MKRFRSWYAPTDFPAVNLQKLCDSYHDKGEMGLPRELIDDIMRYNGPQTLNSCSLTSRAFYSAARPLIHRRMVLGIDIGVLDSLVRGSPPGILSTEAYFDQADAFHASYLSMAEERGLLRYYYAREVFLDLSVGNPENNLQLRQFRALSTVHTLTVNWLALHKILPIFDRCFSQFVPTLRSLRLQAAMCENAYQLMEFICRFPCLNDLALTNPRGLDDPRSARAPRPQQPIPFGGHLVLCGMGPLVQCLLDLPSSIRFHSIEASSHLKDLAKLLVACQSSLEVLRIHCLQSGESSALTLAYHPLKSCRSLASSSLKQKASRGLCPPGIWRDAQRQPGKQQGPPAVRI